MSQLPTYNIRGVDWTLCPSINDVLKLSKGTAGAYMGFVYVIEVGCHIKIGQTRTPRSRLRAIAGTADIYGDRNTSKSLISPPHTNYQENEKFLHQYFAVDRKKGEFFASTIQEFIDACPTIEFRDDTSLLQAKTDAAVSFFMNFITGRSDTP